MRRSGVPVAAGEQLEAVQHTGANESADDGERAQADEALSPPGHGNREQDAADHAGEDQWQIAGGESGATRIIGRTRYHVDDGHGPTTAHLLGGLAEQGRHGWAGPGCGVQAHAVRSHDERGIRLTVAQRLVGRCGVGGGRHLERARHGRGELLGDCRRGRRGAGDNDRKIPGCEFLGRPREPAHERAEEHGDSDGDADRANGEGRWMRHDSS